jgi:hypothetical protein
MIVKHLEKAIVSAWKLTYNSIVEFPGYLLLFAYTLFQIFLYGVLAIVFQYLFLKYIVPWAIIFCTPLQQLDNFFRKDFAFILGVLKDIFKGIEEILNTLDPTGTASGIFKFITNFESFFLLDPDQLKAYLQQLHQTCNTGNDLYGLFTDFVHYVIGSRSCYVARYLYPTKWLYNIYVTLFGWTYPGSAEPFPGPELDKNCNAPIPPLSIAVTCTILKIGYLFVEVILPGFILVLFLKSSGRPIISFIWHFLLLLLTSFVRILKLPNHLFSQ